ncbi:hypothetical protein GCM10007108_06420 [Thermogymnomonas acidicola]|uniref:Thiamine biosynthesis protein ThiS n=1 Tax=Thermogymnomonas acidicola TaxID=399579 RepID=A0AA37F9Q7_9ARCH|nr:MoaD/ThiS family protein [Thermogymnomonas acidicola]GGM71078.1 hypothetical protein GCM10007108_06420 [Thermogymnomonas acidicola]
MITVVGRRRSVIEKHGQMTVDSMFDRLGLSREAHIVLVNGFPATSDRVIDDGDSVVVMEVFSGGQ